MMKALAALMITAMMIPGPAAQSNRVELTTVRQHLVEEAIVVKTYDDTMIVETSDGNQWEYTFDGMTEEEMYAEHVLLMGGEVVAVH